MVFANEIHVGPIWAAYINLIWGLYGSCKGPKSHPGRFNFALNGGLYGSYITYMWLTWVHDYLPEDKLQEDAHIWAGPDIAHIPLFAIIIWNPSGFHMMIANTGQIYRPVDSPDTMAFW